MDYEVFKTKITKPKPAPAPKPDPPRASPPKPPPSTPNQGPGPGPMFTGGSYMEDLDGMSRIPGIRDFEVTYSKTYRWNLDPMEDYVHHYHGQPMASCRSMQWLPPPHAALPPRPHRRQLGPPRDYGPPGMILAPPHYVHDYPVTPPAYGPYGGGYGYYDDHHPEDCRIM